MGISSWLLLVVVVLAVYISETQQCEEFVKNNCYHICEDKMKGGKMCCTNIKECFVQKSFKKAYESLCKNFKKLKKQQKLKPCVDHVKAIKCYRLPEWTVLIDNMTKYILGINQGACAVSTTMNVVQMGKQQSCMTCSLAKQDKYKAMIENSDKCSKFCWEKCKPLREILANIVIPQCISEMISFYEEQAIVDDVSKCYEDNIKEYLLTDEVVARNCDEKKKG